MKYPMNSEKRDEIFRLRQSHIGKNIGLSYDQPLMITRGSGQYLFDEHGRQYLDCVNNVCHVGHCHPRVVQAGQRQMELLNTNTRYLHENLSYYAERLVSTLPSSLEVCFFVCSGSEANELALRLAKTHTGRNQVLVMDHGYHGNGICPNSAYARPIT
jgi:4-aminobutyrate aminotransferase-like enzyme